MMKFLHTDYRSLALMSFFSLFLFSTLFGQNHPNGIDFIGPDGVTYPNFTFAGVEGGIPAVSGNLITVKQNTGNDRQAILTAINTAVNSRSSDEDYVIIYLKNGTYNLSSGITLQDHRIVIRGESKSGVILNITGGGSTHGFHFKSLNNPFGRRTLKVSHARGSREIDFSGSTGFNLAGGQWVRMELDGLPNEFRNRFMPEKYVGYYDGEFAMDVFRIDQVNGKVATVNTPLRVAIDASLQDAEFEAFTPIQGTGVEDLTIRYPNNIGKSDAFNFSGAANCWVKNVYIDRPGSHPFGFDTKWGAKHVSIIDCIVTEPWNKGAGGNAYAGFYNAFDCLMRNCVFYDPRHGPNIQAYACGNVISNCEFYDTNGEMHADFARYNLIEGCTMNKGTNGNHHVWQTKFLHNLTDFHDPTGGGNVLFNNSMDGQKWGGGLRFGGLNINAVAAYNTVKFDGRKGWHSNGYAVEIFDFCEGLTIVGNVFLDRNADMSFKHAGVVFVPGYKPGFGQTGIGNWDGYPSSSIERYASPSPGNSAPIQQTANVVVKNNVFFGVPKNNEMIGYNTPLVDVGNQYSPSIPSSLPSTKPFSPSLYDWQMSISGLSNGGGGSSFPVELISFEVVSERDGLELTWKTAVEENSDFFSVERSTDGILYTQISQVKANGQSSSDIEYNYLDQDVLRNQVYYYRLKIVDIDGVFEYSRTVVATWEDGAYHLTHVYPNPASEEINVQLTIQRDELSFSEIRLSMYDSVGRKVKENLVESGVSQSEFLSTFQVSDLPPGLYFIQIGIDREVVESKEIIVLPN